MKYEARQNVRDAVDWYAERSEDAANHWHAGFLKVLDSLAKGPHRHPSALENSRLPIELREVHYGSGRKLTHRIIFALRTDTVIVYAIRHVAQGEWRPDQENVRD
jgi:plasmid stabilization system protein ParE